MNEHKEILNKVVEFLNSKDSFGTLTIRKGESGKIKRITVSYDQDWHFDTLIDNIKI